MTHKFKNSQEIAETAIKEALAILPFYRNRLNQNAVEIWSKPDGSYVTAVDYLIQYFIKHRIRTQDRHFPIVSEESLSNSVNSQIIDSVLKTIHQIDPKVTKDKLMETMSVETAKPDEPFWTLDPIDGTLGFLKGKAFSIALALISEGIPQLGFLCCPVLSAEKELYRIYSACRNKGSFVYEPHYDKIRRLSLITADQDSKPLIYCETTMASLNHKHADAMTLMQKLHTNYRPLRIDSQYKYALVAEGNATVFLRLPAINSPCKIWDHAAGSLILSEAGGTITDGYGKNLDFSVPPELSNASIIVASTNRKLHNKILDLL